MLATYRWSAYKELRAVSASLAALTRPRNGEEGQPVDIDFFQLPADVVARPVRDGEVRVLVNGIAKICRLEHGALTSEITELPGEVDASRFPILLVVPDQGLVGTSGLYFAMGLGRTLQVWFDQYHRKQNNLNGAVKDAAQSQLRRSQLQFTYIGNINYGPFGSGAWGVEKQSMIDDFMSRHDHNSAIFRRYAHLIHGRLEFRHPAVHLPEPRTRSLLCSFAAVCCRVGIPGTCILTCLRRGRPDVGCGLHASALSPPPSILHLFFMSSAFEACPLMSPLRVSASQSAGWACFIVKLPRMKSAARHRTQHMYLQTRPASRLPCRTEDDYKTLWDEVLCDMKSFRERGPCIKLMRWNSWLEGFEFHQAECAQLVVCDSASLS